MFKKRALPKTYKTLEVIAVEVKIGSNDLLVLSIYRPPKQKRKGNESSLQDLKSVEEELNHICQWACFQKQSVIILGDLNLDRLRLDRAEGKLLKDLEEVNNLQCMVTEPTRVTAHSESLLDVILTNHPELFKKCGVYHPEMSDHHMVFGEMMEKVHKHETRTTTFRQTKSTDFEQLNRDLEAAPWHVGEIFL